jgi:hypothetical protein
MQIRDQLERGADLASHGVAPKSGYHLAELLKCDINDGVEMALFPEPVTSGRLGTSFRYNDTTTAWPVFADLGPWGERLLDIVTDPAEDVKWWKVRMFAKENGYNLPPSRYSGPISTIPDKYFNPEAHMGIRFYGGGPWFWPFSPAEEVESAVRSDDAKTADSGK